MTVNNEFKNLLTRDDIKFTIILGSGFHKQGLKKDTILSSWEMLLLRLNPDCKLTGEYHLDFEKIIESKKIPCEDSHKTEERLIQCVQKLINEEQEKVINEGKYCYPLGIFNPNKVSDVISLNFDEVPELILKKEQKATKIAKFKNDSSFRKESNDSYAFLSTRYKTVAFNKNKIIHFWYPHGTIDNSKSIVLGLHRYAHMVKNGLRIRNHHMEAKRNNAIDNTWYCRLIQNPVLILGASMSPTEWDMWFALTSRNRANGDKQPIFQMRECECKKDAQHEWFQPLFTGMDFNEQWTELEELFKSK